MIQHFPLLVVGILIIGLGSLLILTIARRYRRDLGLEKEKKDKTQETAFIINAFHDVNRQLKDKEKELQRLKALAEQRAENVESYNENILQCVTSGVMTFDKECRLTTVNRAAHDMLGFVPIPKNSAVCKDLFGEGDITRSVHETIEKKKPSARMEAMVDCPAGKIWLGFNTAVLTGHQGEALGVILSFSDLTEVKRLQEQMELRERLTALGEMSAGIAHELRNPMAVISGYLNLLAKKTDTRSRSIIQDITAEINGMNRIIGDLLTFARPASLNRVPVRIVEMVDACLQTVLQATGADSKIKTVKNIDDIEMLADEGLMKQAFSNLFQNAVEAMPDGGTLRVEAQAGRNVILRVSDTGAGISNEVIKKIFVPFFTTKDKGVGMGLALVHKIVLSHGGRIEVNSWESRGTTFIITLPKG